MPYWECVTRSFRIAWARKYLWLIALFSGEAGGFSFNYSQSTSNTSSQTDFATFQNQVTTWLADHVALIVLVAVVWLLLVIAFYILACGAISIVSVALLKDFTNKDLARAHDGV